jgi:hypothetical protein
MDKKPKQGINKWILKRDSDLIEADIWTAIWDCILLVAKLRN